MDWIKQKTWRILLSALILVFFISLILKYGLGISEWKDAIQTSAQIAVVLGLVFAWRQLQITSEQVQITSQQVKSAWEQIEATKDLHRIQFEDSLSKEYRDLIQNIPLKALLGEKLTEKEYKEAKPYLFHYINLTNDQIFLRSKNRISLEVWNDWKGGIKYNLSLPTFKKFWEEIKPKIKSFEELRELEKEEFDTDPKNWKLQAASKNKQLK